MLRLKSTFGYVRGCVVTIWLRLEVFAAKVFNIQERSKVQRYKDLRKQDIPKSSHAKIVLT